MAKVHVCNVLVLDNPAQFLSKLEFEITFECIEDLPEDLEWKIIYVGSAESEEFDQILDTVYVGPVPGKVYFGSILGLLSSNSDFDGPFLVFLAFWLIFIPLFFLFSFFS